VILSWSFISVSDLQLLNASLGIEVTPEGTVKLVSASQWMNAFSSIDVMLSGRLIYERERQLANTPPLMVVTPSGIVMLVSPEHDMNADVSIV